MIVLLKIVAAIVAAIVVFGLGAYALGSTLPREHKASRSLVLKANPEAVWARITDEAAAPEWRKDVKSATRLADRDGHEVWREEFTSGNVLGYETLEQIPPSRFVRRIVDEEMFGGTWTIALTPAGSGTTITVTEDGWVANPLFRLISKYIIGHESTMTAYLHDLAASFGETSEPANM